MARTVPGQGAVIEPLFNSIFGVRDVFVVDGGSGYNQSDPPQLTIGNCGTPIREAVLEPIISNGQIAAVKVLDPGEGYDPFRIKIETAGNGKGAKAKAILYETDQIDINGNVFAPAGSIQYIQVLSNGDEYFSDVVTATVEGGGGSGGKAIATVDLGAIIDISVTNPGGGYSTAPSVLFTRNTNLTKTSRNRQAFNSTLYDITGLLTNVDENDQTIYVQTTDPYPGSGKILIGREVIRYTGKTGTSFTGCDRALNFRYDQKVTLDALADSNAGVSGYNFFVGDRVVRTNESSGNKIARVYDWIPSERALYLTFEVDELAFIDGGSSQIKSQVIDFYAGVASSTQTGVEPHNIIDEAGSTIITLTDPISSIADKNFEDIAELDGAGDGIPDLINTGTDFAGEINLDGGIASSLYGIEETLGGTNTTLFAVGDQMADGSNPPLSPTVSVAGSLGDGDVHVAQVDFLFRSHTTGNYTVGETVVGSITGITGIVTAWDAATKTLSIGSTVGNAGNFLWNNNETITGNGSGIVGTIQQIFYPSSVRNEPD